MPASLPVVVAFSLGLVQASRAGAAALGLRANASLSAYGFRPWAGVGLSGCGFWPKDCSWPLWLWL